jgi:drug/metabolite transporter (DMT)-like permease
MNYLIGFLLVILKDTIYSVANLLDGELSRKTFTSVWSLATINGIVLIPFIPLFFFILKPTIIEGSLWWVILAVALLELFYQIPYYLALRNGSTSVIVSLFSLGRIFIPFFAFAITREILTPIQYFGYAIIIVASVAISFERKAFRLSKALYFMIPTVILLALQDSLGKLGLNNIDWRTYFFWVSAISVPISLSPIFFSRTVRKEMGAYIKNPFSRMYLQMYIQNGLSWVAGGVGTFSLSMLPVTIAKGFSSIHPIIVHFISSKGSKYLRISERETISWRKIALFLLTAIGIILTMQ